MEKQPPTYSQLHEQIESGHVPSVLVERSGGTIQVAEFSRLRDDRGNAITYFEDDGVAKEKSVNPEKLSDAYQEKLARMLGESAVSAVTAPEGGHMSVVVAEVTASADAEKNPRYVKLFQPVVRPEVPSVPVNYDYMFEKDENLARQMEAEQEVRLRPLRKAQEERATYDRFTNEKTKHQAAEYVDRVLAKDRNLAQIIHEELGDASPAEIVDALRESANVRYRAGTYLIDKLDGLAIKHPHAMPDRILRNSQKNPDAKVMPISPMTSREYTAYLALARLDGSFNTDLQGGDGIEYDERTGEVIRGQHRYAAEFLLGS